MAVDELRWVGCTWAAIGGVALVGLALDVPAFSPLEVSGVVLVFGLSVSGAVGGVVLGRRSGPASTFWQMLDLSLMAPAGVHLESLRPTATRAVAAGLATVGFFGVAAAMMLAGTFMVLGKAREEVLTHLPQAAAMVACGWTLTCALAALTVAGWFARWEGRNDRLVLCRPLRSGTMANVYYVIPR